MSYDKDRYIGYVEMATGMGDMLGPAVGGLVFTAYGFSGTFIVFASFVGLGTVVSIITISSHLNERRVYHVHEVKDTHDEDASVISHNEGDEH